MDITVRVSFDSTKLNRCDGTSMKTLVSLFLVLLVRCLIHKAQNVPQPSLKITHQLLRENSQECRNLSLLSPFFPSKSEQPSVEHLLKKWSSSGGWLSMTDSISSCVSSTSWQLLPGDGEGAGGLLEVDWLLQLGTDPLLVLGVDWLLTEAVSTVSTGSEM